MTEDNLIFFCHLPKTAGTSLSVALEEHVGEAHVLPDRLMIARGRGLYPPIDAFMQTLRFQRRAIRLVRGHYHLSLRKLLGQPKTMAVIREPVARSVSHVKHLVRSGAYSREEIISVIEKGELPFQDNLMTRYLGGDITKLKGTLQSANRNLIRGKMENPEERLQQAKSEVEKLDFLGITEDMQGFSEKLKNIGIDFDANNRKNSISGTLDLEEKHLDVIRAHNRLDMELYDFARQVQ